MTSLIQVSDPNVIIYISSTSFFGELQTIRDIGGTRNSSNTITISTINKNFADGTNTRIIDTPYASLTLNPSTGTIIHAFPFSYNGTSDIQSLTVDRYLELPGLTNIYNSLYIQSNISNTGFIDSTVDILIGCNSAATMSNVISTVQNMGQTYLSTIYYVDVNTLQSKDYIYKTDLYSKITNLPYVLSASLQSTFNGLGTYGYVSSFSNDTISNTYITYSNLQSTIAGLGSSNYVSTSYLVSTTTGISNSIYSPSIISLYTSLYTSTVDGLGSSRYISTGDLVSTVKGLGSLGSNGSNYISTASLTSSITGLCNSILFPSTVAGLGQIYISTPQLTSTITGIFNNESLQLQSTVNNLGKKYISTAHLTSTVQGLGQIYISSETLMLAISNVVPGDFLKNSNLVSTVEGLGMAGYVSSTGLFSTVSNVSASNTSYYKNIINTLGFVGYISTASLVSTVNGLGKKYMSTQGLTAFVPTEINPSLTLTQLTSSIQNLGTKGFISTPALVSTTTYYKNLTTYSLDYDYFITNSITNLFSNITWPFDSGSPQQLSQIYAPNSNTISYTIAATSFTNSTVGAFPPISSSNYFSSTFKTGTLNVYTIVGTNITQSNLSSHVVTTFINGASVGLTSIRNICINSANTFLFITARATPTLNGVTNPIYNNGYYQVLAINVLNSRITMLSDELYTGYYQFKLGNPMSNSYRGAELYNGIMAIDASDTLYLGIFPWYNSGTWLQDSVKGPIQKISLSNLNDRTDIYGAVTTLAGQGPSYPGFSNDTGAAARFYNSAGVAVDSASNVYVADQTNHAIRKITPLGVVTTFAGQGPSGSGFSNATGTNARFNNPTGVAVDSSGIVYVSDAGNHAIRKITPAGVVTTLAGGVFGYAEGTGTNAQFKNPYGLAVDSASNVYVADYDNYLIRKITPAGVVTTLAGLLRGFSDGIGTNAQFYGPIAVACDLSGNVYVGDDGTHTIRKITPQGLVTNIAGKAYSGAFQNGTGTNARFLGPYGITVDSSGTIYVGDRYNNAIRQISPAGVVTTLAGSNAIGNYFNAIGTAARFNNPYGVAVDSSGYVYVGDYTNNTIRKIVGNSTMYDIFYTMATYGLTNTYIGNADMTSIISGLGTLGYLSSVTMPTLGVPRVDSDYITTPALVSTFTDINNINFIPIQFNDLISTTTGIKTNLTGYTTSSLTIPIPNSVSQICYMYSSNAITFANSIQFNNSYTFMSNIYSYCNIKARNFYAQIASGANGYYFADGTLLNSSSDRRLKQDIIPLSNTIEKIMQLSGVYYTRKDDTESKRQIGFIAQDVETIFPELIFTDESVDKNKSMKYDSMNVILLEAIKELDIQCDELLNTLSSNI